MSKDGSKLDSAIRAVMSLPPTKGKPPRRPTKADATRRFKLKVARGKPRIEEVK